MSKLTETLTERVPSFDRDGREAYRVVAEGRDLSTTVVRAVAEVCDWDPFAQGDVLHDVVDPDALERVFRDCHDGTPRTTGRIIFELQGCLVEIHATGSFLVYGPIEEQSDPRTSAAGPA